MRVLLLTTPNPDKVKTWVCQESSVVGSILPPTDLCYVGAVAQANGHTARVEDLRLAPRRWRARLTEATARFAPDAIVTNLTTTSLVEDLEMLRSAKAARPAATVAAFGTHAESRPEEVFAGGVDVVLVGDPEQAVLNLLTGRATEGLWRRGSPRPLPATLSSLDDLPHDGLSLVDLDRYHAAHHPGAGRFAPLMASRGCPYRCTYCLYPTLFGRKARYRSAASMVAELETLSRRFGVVSVNYLDATFNLNRQRLLDYCQRLADAALPVRWACNARCDLFDGELAAQMAAAGCERVYFGVEDPSQFDTTEKHLSFDAVRSAFASARAHGIDTVAFLMLFREGASSEQDYVRRMGALIDELDPDAVQINLSIPFPGTEDFERLAPTLTLDWSLFDPGGHRLPYASPIDLVSVKRQLYRRFLRRHPRKAWRVLRRMPLKRLPPLARRFVTELLLPAG